MDIVETIELENLGDQTRQVPEELMEATRLRPGQILVVGCPSNEIDSFKIGSHPSAEIGMAVYTTLCQELKSKGIYLATQCCEHLNRALILETEAAQAYDCEPVNVIPQLKAGGPFTTAACAALEHPVAMEYIGAHTEIDISDTLTGTHVKDVAAPVRIKTKEIGDAHVACARTKPKFIDGVRARYDEENV